MERCGQDPQYANLITFVGFNHARFVPIAVNAKPARGLQKGQHGNVAGYCAGPH